MSDDETKEKLWVTFRRAKTGTISEEFSQAIGKEGRDVTSRRTTTLKSTRTLSQRTTSKTGVSGVTSFVLDEDDKAKKFGKMTVSKKPILEETDESIESGINSKKRFIVGRTSSRTSPSRNTISSHFLAKLDMARSILDGILSKLTSSQSTIDFSSSFRGQFSTSQVSEQTSLTLESSINKTLSRPGLRISQYRKETYTDEIKKQHLSSIVRGLDLPIEVPETKPFLDSRPKIEQLIFDTHIYASSTIIGEQSTESEEEILSTAQSSKGGIEKRTILDSPFELTWCFGFNPEVDVLNLSKNDSSLILFANSQYAVLYDFHADTMSFLQGHRNSVSCLSADDLGSLVVTADSGTESETSRVIIWDIRPCVLEVMDNVHPFGCDRVSLSCHGNYLVTVSANEILPCIKVWDWRRNSKNASATETVKDHLGEIRKLTRHSNSELLFAVTFENGLVFINVVAQIILHEVAQQVRRSEAIGSCNFDTIPHLPFRIGSFTDTTFLEDHEAVALSSTSKGYVVVWGEESISKQKIVYKKHVRLHLDCITNIESVDRVIAVATVSGNISFYDYDLKILYFQKTQMGALVSLSFNLSHQHSDVRTCEKHDSCAKLWRHERRQLVDATIKNEPFSVRHFVVSTESGRIAYFNAASGVPKYILFPSKATFTAMDTLPNSKFLCAGTASGQCLLFDTDDNKVKVSQQIKVQTNMCQAISYIKYSPSGHQLACGMYTGDIWLLDPLLLTPNHNSPLIDCSSCITEMTFSPDSDYLVVADVSFCITAYCLQEKPILLGQYIEHSKSIKEIFLAPADPDSTHIMIFSIGADRNISEFVIDKESNTFQFVASQRVEQSAIPQYFVTYPCSSGIQYLCVNSEMKFKLFDPPSPQNLSLARTCSKTLQAPDLGYPINHLEIFKKDGFNYLFFRTNHHIGLHLLPIDGNPYKALAFRASPTDIICSKIHPNGKYVFAISERCTSISMWTINTQAVEKFHESGGEGLEPFLRTLDKEKEKDLREFFELGQFLHQGESPSIVRHLTNTLPICEVANVLQALGCLLTKYQTEEITKEIIGSDPSNPQQNITYEDFVRLYLNHRPNREITLNDLREAFRDFYAGVYYTPGRLPSITPDMDPVFDCASFIKKLLVTGEEMLLSELYADFSILTGGHAEYPENSMVFQVPPTMPKEISFEVFVRDILGFSLDMPISENRVLSRSTTV